jgi:hypothetical protein
LCRVVKELPVSRFAEQDWRALIVEAKGDLLEYNVWRTQGQIRSSNSSYHEDDASSDESATAGNKHFSPEDPEQEASPQRNVRRRSGSE